MYAYKVTATITFSKIVQNTEKIQSFFDSYNSDCYNEWFYYSCEDNDFEFETSYDTKIKFNFDKCYYTFSHVCHHKENNMIDQFKQMYDVKDFDINEIFDNDGGCKEEFYKKMEIDEIVIKSSKLSYKVYEDKKYEE